jgi:hypothetical protein
MSKSPRSLEEFFSHSTQSKLAFLLLSCFSPTHQIYFVLLAAGQQPSPSDKMAFPIDTSVYENRLRVHFLLACRDILKGDHQRAKKYSAIWLDMDTDSTDPLYMFHDGCAYLLPSLDPAIDLASREASVEEALKCFKYRTTKPEDWLPTTWTLLGHCLEAAEPVSPSFIILQQ